MKQQKNIFPQFSKQIKLKKLQDCHSLASDKYSKFGRILGDLKSFYEKQMDDLQKDDEIEYFFEQDMRKILKYMYICLLEAQNYYEKSLWLLNYVDRHIKYAKDDISNIDQIDTITTSQTFVDFADLFDVQEEKLKFLKTAYIYFAYGKNPYDQQIKTNFEKLIEEESSLLSGIYVDENHSVANELYHKKQINDLFSEEVPTIEPFVRIK